MSGRTQSIDGDERTSLLIKRGALSGIKVFLAGYAVTYLFVMLSARNFAEQGEFADTGIEGITGWFFYNMHLVEMISAGSRGGAVRPRNLFAEVTTLTPPLPVWYLVPVVFLVIGGYLMARSMDRPSDTLRAAMTGATIAGGYLLMSVLGMYLFGTSARISNVSIGGSPETAPPVGLLLVGVVYPLVFGAVGGVVASLRTESDEDVTDEYGAQEPSQGNQLQ